jgi:protein gp37
MGTEKYVGLTRRSGGRAKWTGKVRLDQSALAAPLSWRKPSMVFVNSMSDLFHDGVPFSFVQRVWSTMEKASQHTYQILTKRPDRMAAMSQDLPMLSNVWLGTSVESKEYLSRIDHLKATRAAVRFISFEPLLNDVGRPDLSDIHWAIVGGESGPASRPMEQGWVENIRLACERDSTAFFFKQWGGVNKKRAGRELHGKTWDGFPSKPALEDRAQ